MLQTGSRVFGKIKDRCVRLHIVSVRNGPASKIHRLMLLIEED